MRVSFREINRKPVQATLQWHRKISLQAIRSKNTQTSRVRKPFSPSRQ
jgi:hypothetical protein